MKISTKLIICLIAASLCSTTMMAETVTNGDYQYEVKGNNLSVKGLTATAVMRALRAFELNGTTYNVSFPTAVKVNEYFYPITEIADSAFYGLPFLGSVTLESTISRVGCSAFENCASLTTVNTAAAFLDCDAFANNPSLNDLTLAEGTQTLEEMTFANCTSLVLVGFPASLNGYFNEPSAFEGCTSLKFLAVSSDNADYCSVNNILYNKDQTELRFCPQNNTAFAGELPATVQIINNQAFWGNQYDGTIELPPSVTTVRNHAFYEAKLTGLDIGGNVSYLGDFCLAKCHDLKMVICHPTVVPSASDDTFNRLILSNINLYVPKNCVTAYEEHPVWTKFNIKGFVDADASSSMFDYTFTNASGDTPASAVVNGLSDAVKEIISNYNLKITAEIPELVYHAADIYTVTSTAYESFKGQSGIKKVIIPNIASVGSFSFSNCPDLEQVDVAAKTISSYAINNNNALTELNINQGVETIVYGAMSNNPLVTLVYLPASLTSLSTSSFLQEGLQNILVSSQSTTFTYQAGVLFNRDKTTLLRWPASNVAFDGNMPQTLNSIGEYACLNLHRDDVVLPDNVTSIGYRAFADAKIKTISLGQNMSNVANFAFAGCNDMEAITCHAVNPPQATNLTFNGVDKPSVKLYVPKNSVGLYLADDAWKDFDIEGLAPAVYGDVNGDGEVTVGDVSAVYDIILGLSEEYKDAADINGDGEVTVGDVSAIYSIILGS